MSISLSLLNRQNGIYSDKTANSLYYKPCILLLPSSTSQENSLCFFIPVSLHKVFCLEGTLFSPPLSFLLYPESSLKLNPFQYPASLTSPKKNLVFLWYFVFIMSDVIVINSDFWQLCQVVSSLRTKPLPVFSVHFLVSILSSVSWMDSLQFSHVSNLVLLMIHPFQVVNTFIH